MGGKHGEILTRTLAEIYLTQGNPQKALKIYQRILEREPASGEMRSIVERLAGLLVHNHNLETLSPAPPSADPQIRKLKQWLGNIQAIKKLRCHKRGDVE